MKTIGLLGGMSWESTSNYYKAINQGIKASLGGLHSAKVCLFSVNFAEIESLQHQGDWQQTAEILSNAAKSVEAGGADCLLICTNTMHKVAEEVQRAISIPLLHIADATASTLLLDGIRTVGLLGTQFTMSQNFYKGRLTEHHGIDVIVPNETQQEVIHHIIYSELCLGEIKESSRHQYLEIIDDLYQQGAQAVILGCTEIALLVQQQDTQVPLYDTTQIHAACAVKFALHK
ncbi:aspartate racemase [Shewanella sp. UCD-FRSSP16_17]|uniref:aspartate/glutamate racemase family protein n=1 Tax=unclassified Shewanella TaxID=196818 RepID=UPI0007EEE6E0|nr:MULTISPECIES: aspartate/glutamate racemase family protein [unclassified Shewanella]MBQ4889049.1 aspartate/glutamate racemase family protein [Shewanella sp. MMG014]OBT11275.1 aspartate racemase [Shewanella sp. UCD-FRSSP16_17]